MWDPPDSITRRFPLVARPRPACLPLPQRIRALAELADTAQQHNSPSVASTVYNQAALISSDIGDSATARALCHQHADAYLRAAPLHGKAAISALEPLVNLARLHLRAGLAGDGHQLLLTLFRAVTTASPVEVDGITVPADLVANTADRQDVRTWLWGVLLADGTRALTAAGRWSEALAHVETHRGVGQRMLDGRQVAVLAALTSGNTHEADTLLAHTVPQEAWEKAVTDCLAVLCDRVSGRPRQPSLRDLVSTFLDRPNRDDLVVFDTRLGLAVLDMVDSPTNPVARPVVAELHRRTMNTSNGYTAREILSHPLFTALATDREAQDCRALLRTCLLEAGTFPNELRDQLTAAIRISDQTIRRSVRPSRHTRG